MNPIAFLLFSASLLALLSACNGGDGADEADEVAAETALPAPAAGLHVHTQSEYTGFPQNPDWPHSTVETMQISCTSLAEQCAQAPWACEGKDYTFQLAGDPESIKRSEIDYYFARQDGLEKFAKHERFFKPVNTYPDTDPRVCHFTVRAVEKREIHLIEASGRSTVYTMFEDTRAPLFGSSDITYRWTRRVDEFIDLTQAPAFLDFVKGAIPALGAAVTVEPLGEDRVAGQVCQRTRYTYPGPMSEEACQMPTGLRAITGADKALLSIAIQFDFARWDERATQVNVQAALPDTAFAPPADAVVVDLDASGAD